MPAVGPLPRESVGSAAFRPARALKHDLLGRVEHGTLHRPTAVPVGVIQRDALATPRWTRALARSLAAREARALAALGDLRGVPRLVTHSPGRVIRTFIEGETMRQAQPRDVRYFAAARRLLAQIHRRGVVHNDLAKEPNWLVTPEREPAVVDFQLAVVFRRRGRLFRLMAREDVRHLVKHKRKYCPAHLTAHEKALLARPSVAARALRRLMKPVYNLVTRRLLGWADREGRGLPAHRGR